jgi:formamidopyrimidine-DNA glycosylase
VWRALEDLNVRLNLFQLVGRTLLDTGRYGKVFYLTLNGEGRTAVLHLGMTGMLQIRGEEAAYYRKKPKQDQSLWPPKFMKVSQLVSMSSTELTMHSVYPTL